MAWNAVAVDLEATNTLPFNSRVQKEKPGPDSFSNSAIASLSSTKIMRANCSCSVFIHYGEHSGSRKNGGQLVK
ncbi:hypothetical protein T265_04585 [Opisthorchis viverrini]|uniref:Uncharacterized protein n=1 Tax=Opisthorchis viverrini TaxID=6198 RepID=A0A074ZMM9_OPIVI|nr:hypothetical protein T265_04585 [Opisthorchis viverrini]KER28633.1 hypothetical protein T265_04585 [Opisthorchis viverrini]